LVRVLQSLIPLKALGVVLKIVITTLVQHFHVPAQTGHAGVDGKGTRHGRRFLTSAATVPAALAIMQ